MNAARVFVIAWVAAVIWLLGSTADLISEPMSAAALAKACRLLPVPDLEHALGAKAGSLVVLRARTFPLAR